MTDPVIVQFEVSMSQLVKVVSSLQKVFFFFYFTADVYSVCKLWASTSLVTHISLCSMSSHDLKEATGNNIKTALNVKGLTIRRHRLHSDLWTFDSNILEKDT